MITQEVEFTEKQKRLVSMFRQFVDSFNYHEYKIVNNQKNTYPKRDKNELISNIKQKQRRYITIDNYWLHFEQYKTLGYNNNYLNNRHLIMIDLDCHDDDPDKIKSCFEAARLIEKHLGIPIYWEPSTQGTSLHGYCIFEKSGCIQGLNDFLEILEIVLTELCPMLKQVELLGRANDYANLSDLKMETPAKLPRGNGLGDITRTGTVSFNKLWELVEKKVEELEQASFGGLNTGQRQNPLPCTIDGYKKNNKSIKNAPYKNMSSVIEILYPHIHAQFGDFQILKQKKNRIVTCSHVVYLLAIMFMSIESGKKQISYKLIERHWRNMHSLGIIKEAWNINIVCKARMWLTQNNIISFIEQQYNPTYVKPDGEIVEGQACIYDMDTDLVKGLQKIRNGKGGGESLFSTSLKYSFSLPKNENVYAINRLRPLIFDPVDLENYVLEPTSYGLAC